MSSAASSPNRGSNKVTYRAKRRRSTIDKSYRDSGGESDGESEQEPAIESVKKMATRTPKKVDVHLPGPSPKRGQTETSSAKKPASTKGKRGTHSRAGSIASLARDGTLDAMELSPAKPVSAASAKPRSQVQRTDTEEAGDEEVVVGEKQGRYASRKNEAERRQFLEEDPHSGDVEPHRAFCNACNKWIDLNPSRRFIMKNWVEHRRRCGERSGSPAKAKVIEEPVEPEPEEEEAPASPTAPVHDIFSSATKRIKREDDRRAILENDPLAGEVKPDSVFCRNCQTLIKLSKETRFSLHPWRLHVQKCSNDADDRPGTRVAAAQRKLQLVNDTQVKSFTPRSVECKKCDAHVELDGKTDYELTKWDQHKTTCVATPLGSTRSALRSPPSITSTEETVVATETGTPRKGKKRSREDDEEPDRAVRQRGASYEPPQGENPGFLERITAPFFNFFRGFREGLAG